MSNVRKLLADYATVKAGMEQLRLERESIEYEIMGEEVVKKLDEVRIEYGDKFDFLDEERARIERELREAVLDSGDSVTGSGWRVVYSSGKVRVNMKKLKEIAKDNIEVAEAISEKGKPFTMIKALKR